MSHSHHAGATAIAVDRRVVRVLTAVVAVLTAAVLVGVVALWPRNVDTHVQRGGAGIALAGGATAVARVDSVTRFSCRGLPGSTQQNANSDDCGRMSVTVQEGNHRGLQALVPVPKSAMAAHPRAGDRVVLAYYDVPGQPTSFQFADYERSGALLVLAVVFVLVLAVVARLRGLLSVVGLVIAGAVLLGFLFPALICGENALAVGVVASLAIMIVVIYTAHGISVRSTTALLGTVLSVLLSAAMAAAATGAAHLTGLVADDDLLLSATAPDLNLAAALTCGIVIASLGVLNDITITQASAVWELADTGARGRDLYARAMRIGRDHIASTVYTIAFATAGASLTTFLMITAYRAPLPRLAQYEMFAEEIVRTLVGAVGLVLAVPLTTALGVALVGSQPRREMKPGRAA